MKQKKTRENCLNEEQEQILADFYGAHREFYDKTMDEYRNSKKKNRLLQQKAEELGITGELDYYTSPSFVLLAQDNI